MKRAIKLEVGSKAPLFELEDEQGHLVSLKDVIATSPVVLFFYPGDMTPGCTMQLCAVRDEWKDFQTAGVSVYGVNHAESASHKAFSDKYTFPFPLLIDKDKYVSEKYGALKKFFRATVINRTVVGIGKDGNIFYYKRGIPKNADILKAVPKS